tara:strand:+ start:2720 stop:4684 length:1965 start_codon:yes stop_codon:yes gene_type:complete
MSSLFFINTSLSQHNHINFDTYPSPTKTDLWLNYNKEATQFKVWSPKAEKVHLNLYEKGMEGVPIYIYSLQKDDDGVWLKKIQGDLNGKYYTYQIMMNGVWLEETPGIYAQAVGVNGKRAMVLDLNSTNPEDWSFDKGPKLKYANEAIIYELHIRDMTIHPQSGSTMPGKYLGLVENGTTGPHDRATGIDHLKELGITHVHLLPTYDHYSIDETKLDSAQFNWGYDPQNYNVPEGSFSSDPYHAEVRIKEFKQMIKTFHDNGIGIILDVVYNHTGRTENSNFNLENPGYYYRHWENGNLSDAAACGNETASERKMMRKFIVESVAYWAKEYHLDGFRFDLMGIHDIETMNLISEKLKTINPHIIIYGEGWTAGDSPLPIKQRALKKSMQEIPLISAFSDDIRDGIKGSVFENTSTGFVSGAKNKEESIKFGIVGAIQHPQINYKKVNYSDAPWSKEPWQAISYVSCHDNHTLFDKLTVSRRDASKKEIIAMDKLANGIVLTSQGVAFIHAGAEMLRTKKEEHNSYNLPDSINQINWNWKNDHIEVVNYYKNLIALRKSHPAFRMTSTADVSTHLKFKKSKKGVVGYNITNYANGDAWKNIMVIYNAKAKAIKYRLKGKWKVAVLADVFDLKGMTTIKKKVKIPAISMAILFQED